MGNQTLYELDPANGLVLEERRVVGLDDRSSTETDDVVTSFTYTPAPATQSDPPAGLVETITDPLGRLTQIDYNAQGLPTMVTYAVGTSEQASVQFEYDSADRLTAEIDELGRGAEYAYDNLDRLIQLTLPDPDGAGSLTSPIYTFDYDANNRLVKETDPLGNVTQYAYDDDGHLSQITRPDHDGDGQSTITTLAYTARGQLDNVTDPLGRVTSYVYDALSRNTSVTLPDPDGAGSQTSSVIQYSYDNLHRLTQLLDPLSNPTDVAYENFGSRAVITQADPDGAGSQTRPQTTTEYDSAGNLISETDALGNVTTYQYDELNRLTKITLPDPDGAGSQTSPVTQYAYDKAGNLRYITDPKGLVIEYIYDARNRVTQVVLPDPDVVGGPSNVVYAYAYDDAGQLTSETDPLGNTTSYEYDNLGQLTKTTLPDPDGAGLQAASVYTYTYDAVGNVLTETDPLGNTTSYEYDAHYNRTKITDAELGVTTFTYDDAGNLLTLTDPVSNTTSWVYDGLDRVIEETNALAATRYFEYDAASNLTRRTDRNGRVIEFDYDNLHRRTAERWLDEAGATERTLSFAYDAASNLTSASDPAASYTYAYDALSRITSVTHDITGLAPQVVLSHAYDAASNRTQLSATIGEVDDFVTDYSYDNLHRMTRIEQQGQTGGNAVAEKRIDLAYDAAGRFDTITRYADLAATKLVATSGYIFDNAGRLTELTHAAGSTTLADYSWSYDVANRITQFTSLTDGTVNYTYDSTDQLIGANYDYQTDESYSYDANGNRTNTGYSTGANNHLTSDGTYNYEYDAEGNRTKRTHIASGELTEYTWDHRNRLVKVTERVSDGGAATKVVEYDYDVFGRRVAKHVDSNADGAFDDESYYVSDGERHERGAAGDHIALAFDGNGDLTNRYLHGPAVDQIFADEQVTDVTQPGEVLWPLTDNQGTVRDIAKWDDAQGTSVIANHITYDAFGAITAETDSTVDHIFASTGRVWDADAELYDYRARWFDPAAGRFLTQDPIAFEAADSSLYRYVGNNPANSTDPSGLKDPAKNVDDPRWWKKDGWAGTAWNPWSWWGPHRWVLNRFAGYHAAEDKAKDVERATRKQARESAYHCTDQDQLNESISRARSSYRLSPVESAQMQTYAETAIEANAAMLGGGLIGSTSRQSGHRILAQIDHLDDLDNIGAHVAASKPSRRVPPVPHTYVNPGHHVPGTPTYIAGKSVLPSNHVRLFNRSVPVRRLDGKIVRWTREKCGGTIVYHRFEQHLDGEFHWTGSTAGRLPDGQPRAIPLNDVPVRKIEESRR